MSLVSASSNNSSTRWPLLYTGVALTTLATLLLELSLTRVFSVVFYYHLAFLAISIALFGLGAGGVYSYLAAPRSGPPYLVLARLALLDSVAVVAALAWLLTRRGEMDTLTLAGVYFAAALPFFFAGTIVSLAISSGIERVDRVYFFDLLGAAGGCLVLIPLMRLGAPNAIFGVAVLMAATGAIWYTMARDAQGRVAAVVLALVLVAAAALNMRFRFLDVTYAKDHELAGETFVQWNSMSRIAIAPDNEGRHQMIFIDADASTGIANFNFDNLDPDTREGLLGQGPGLPYRVKPGAKTLVIGPGGGWDISRALASGSKDVTGVEINKIIAETIMKQRFPQLSQRLYFRPEVRVFNEDGRSFVRRSEERYQVIQATLVDTWASTAAGAYSLSENSLYTVEAFRDYLDHLTPDGVLAFTRWGFKPARESLRTVTLAVAALEQLGETGIASHIAVGRENVNLLEGWGATDTILVFRKPVDAAGVARIREAMAVNKLQPVYLPGESSGSEFADFLNAKDRRAFFEAYPYDVSPVTDNRPFFFYTVQPRDLWAFVESASRSTADFKINRAVPMLFGVVAVSVAATAVILLLPPLLLSTRLPTEGGVRRFLPFFVAIGVGYILVQVALIQKFVLFLGHPTYALTVIIFAMLVSSGMGSYWSRRMGAFEPRNLARVLAAAAVILVVFGAAVPALAGAGVGWPLAARIVFTIVLIFPAGFAMGMPFPSALAILEAWHNPAVRWAWSLNAASSVLGSALAIFLALYLGLQGTLFAGAACYMAALAILRWGLGERYSKGNGTVL